MSPRIGALTVALLLVPTLAACGGGDEGGAPDGTTQGSYGDTQQTSWETDSGVVTIDLTVSEPRAGSVDDFADIDVTSSGVDPTGKSPYYVDVTYEVVEGGPFDASVLPGISTSDAEENPAEKLFLTGSQEFEPCPPQPLEPQQAEAGDTIEGCQVIVLEEGAEPGVTFYYPANDDEDPVTWQ